MYRKLKSLLVLSMFVFIGACCNGVNMDETFYVDLNPEITSIAVVPDEDGVYKIYRPGHLAWLAKVSQDSNNNFYGKTVRVIDDIDMGNRMFSGIPNFAGKFEGNHKKISNLRIGNGLQFFRGLIGDLEEGGHIENLTIESGSIQGLFGVGSFVGMVTGSSTIKNVVNKAEVSGGVNVGGLVGLNLFEGAVITIDNSSNHGSVNSESFSGGGLIGFNDSILLITNSSNTGTVVGKSDYIGGLVGSTDLSLTIDNSSNSGDVTGVIDVGGLVGVSQEDSFLIAITNSSNTGSTKGKSHVGGIVGNLYSMTTTKLNITNVYSYARIVKGDVLTTGGIIGKVTRGIIEVNDSYWLYDDTDGSNVVGVNRGRGIIDGTNLPGSSALNIAKFKNSTDVALNFIEWDFTADTGTWIMGTDYPLLRSLQIVAQ